MKGFQPFPFPLKSPAFAAGSNDTVTMETLPDTIFNRLAHLVGFVLDIAVTPSYTTAPTINGIMSMINSLVFFDGANERINLSGQQIRLSNIHWQGRNPIPDPDTNTGTGNPIRFTVPVLLGPPNFAGAPTDWALPCAALKSAELRLKFGALTDFSADCTALNSVNIKVTALIVPLDNEFRVPPAIERRAFNFGTNEAILQGKALYSHLFITKQSLGAFATNDLGDITIDTGIGSVPALIASSLSTIHQLNNSVGQFTQNRGEPRNSGDDNEKTLNLGTPTALVAADAILQSVISCQDDARISKLIFEATSAMKVKWSGSFATPTVVVTRILEQNETAQAAMAAKVASTLNRGTPKASRIKGLDSREYGGPRGNYMPRVFKY